MLGIRLATLYSWKPHQLGFCGPKDKGLLLKYLRGENISKKKIREILEAFEGAYPYYKFIAKSNNINDPFDERVVRTYWITQHIHHVLVVGSVTGRIVLKGKLLDLCRVSWGKVVKLFNSQFPISKVVVEYQPLIGKKKLKLGKLVKKEVDWDKSLLLKLKMGDWISIHWNQAIEVLTDKDRKNLEKYTRMTLNIV